MDRQGAGSGREKGEVSFFSRGFHLSLILLITDPACRFPAFVIVPTDREPGTG